MTDHNVVERNRVSRGSFGEVAPLEEAAAIYKRSFPSGSTGRPCGGLSQDPPTLSADLLGDWREELVVRETNNTALRVYTTTDVTARRIYTLMHDPTYRMQVTWEQSSYNQPPHTGFHIGADMADPPRPDIRVK